MNWSSEIIEYSDFRSLKTRSYNDWLQIWYKFLNIPRFLRRYLLHFLLKYTHLKIENKHGENYFD